MLWCQGAQNIGLFNHQLEFSLQCTVWSQCTPVPDGQTNEHHGKARRFVITNASRAKNQKAVRKFHRTWPCILLNSDQHSVCLVQGGWRHLVKCMRISVYPQLRPMLRCQTMWRTLTIMQTLRCNFWKKCLERNATLTVQPLPASPF